MNAAATCFWTAWATLAVLVMVFWLTFNVGRARARFKVDAPATDGPPAFSSVLRVHANTVEQMVLFLPALWLCAIFYSDRFAAACAVVWLAGRVLYALGYYRDPAKRGPGFGIAMLATMLLIGATVRALLLA